MLVRSLIVVLVVGNLLAAEAGTTALGPPNLSKLSKQQFQRLLSQGLADQPALSAGQSSAVIIEQNLCSIPLLKWKVDHPERFSMPRPPVGSKNIDRIGTPPPAPECPDK